MARVTSRAIGFLGLRAKFMIFFSLILIIACSSLSWYYVEERREKMAENLHDLGTILLASVAHNEHFQYAGLVAEDRATLQQFIEGLVAVEDVVYVVITRPDGTVLAQHSKGARQSSGSLVRSVDHPLYPETMIAKQIFQSPNATPLMTRFSLTTKVGSRFAWEEILYDFAEPVMRTTTKGGTSLPPFSIQMDEGRTGSSPTQPALVYGLVQIGLSDARRKQELLAMLVFIFVITILIICIGMLGAHLLTTRVTKPLRNLARVAKQVAEGRTPESLIPSTHDEVGQLAFKTEPFTV